MGSYSTLTSTEAAVLGGVIAGLTGTIALLGIVFWVLIVIAHWKMFVKAGEAGWKSIIPVYSDYVLYRLVWDTKNFWITLGLSLAAGIVSGLGTSYTVTANGNVVASGGNPIFSVLGGILGIATLVWGIRASLKTAYAYGKGTGFGVGLVLLPNIFALILGFGSAEYVGPQDRG